MPSATGAAWFRTKSMVLSLLILFRWYLFMELGFTVRSPEKKDFLSNLKKIKM